MARELDEDCAGEICEDGIDGIGDGDVVGTARGGDGVTSEGDWPADVICDGVKSEVAGGDVEAGTEEVVVGCGTAGDGDDSGAGAGGGSGLESGNGETAGPVNIEDVPEKLSRKGGGAGCISISVGLGEAIVVGEMFVLSRLAVNNV